MCDPLEQQHKVVLSSQPFTTKGNDVTILFGLKNENYCGVYKHEKLICMPCHLERYLPFHPGRCHIFHTMAQFLLENLLMDHFFLYPIMDCTVPSSGEDIIQILLAVTAAAKKQPRRSLFKSSCVS